MLVTKRLGVDDWALKRGQTFGTILVDLDQHCVIDLLPDRSADTLACWLTERPMNELVTRDRAADYAKGVRAGAPQAVQVADRWHLLKSLREATEKALRKLYPQLMQQADQGEPHCILTNCEQLVYAQERRNSSR